MIILGLDPGYADTGYGLIKTSGQDLVHLAHGTIKTSSKIPFPDRLVKLHEQLKSIIDLYQPDSIVIEKIYFSKNIKTAMDVGQARGVLVLTAIQAQKEIREFTPMQIKQAITGYGGADKKQIQQMIKILLNLKNTPKPDDAADALAVAITAAHTTHTFL